jgi:hypothetical protein
MPVRGLFFVVAALLLAGLAQAQSLKDFTLGEKMQRKNGSDGCPVGFRAIRFNLKEDIFLSERLTRVCVNNNPGTIANLPASRVELEYMESRLESVTYIIRNDQDSERLLGSLRAKYGNGSFADYGQIHWELNADARLGFVPNNMVYLSSKKFRTAVQNAAAQHKFILQKQSDDL